MTTDDLIRHVDDLELPAPGWWPIARQPVTLHRPGWRRRVLEGTVSGGVTIAADPRRSSLDLLVSITGDERSASEIVVHADVVSLDRDGIWRFVGTTDDRRPITVDALYRGVFRHRVRAVAWLTMRAALPAAGGRRGLTFVGDVNADHPQTVER